MSVNSGFLKISGSPLKGVNPQPFFRDLPFDLETARGDGFPPDKAASFGRETAFRVLPYSMQDRYDRELIPLEIPSVILENNFLKAEILPSFGGRIWSLYDKINKRDLVYKNPVFRPCNLAIRDAWFSGGIEWNIGRLGHSVHTSSPVFAGLVKDGALQVLRLWEFERQTRLFWRVDLILPDDSPTLFAYVRIENPDAEKKPLYWWTNTAVPQTADVRVFSAASDIIYIVPGTGKTKTMGGAKLPALPTLPGADASFPAASTYSNEYFFQNDKACIGGKKNPWESVVYADGYAFAEASTAPLVYRKMFCWGSGRGGRRWQEFLSLPKEEYLEVQAGLAPTQLHTADIEKGGVVDWVQGFGALLADADKARQKDYGAARSYVENLLEKRIGAESLCAVLAKGRQLASVPPAEIMAQGTGWGCLEQNCPPGLLFPFSSIGAEELPWYELQKKGKLPARQSEEGPGAFLTDPLWAPLLEASLRHGGSPNDWLGPYHLGVMAFENGETEKAVSYWLASLKARENPWACRNLAKAALREKDAEKALAYYKKAFAFPEAKTEASFADEYITLLLKAKGKEAAWDILSELSLFQNPVGFGQALGKTGQKPGFSPKSKEAVPKTEVLEQPQFIKQLPGGNGFKISSLSEPLREILARISLEKGDYKTLDEIFALEPCHVREGNNTMTDLWNEYSTIKKGSPSEPPGNIDFRMF